ncbi:MAG: hypothetical protein ACLGIG_08080 [Actinomycetes bacterium]
MARSAGRRSAGGREHWTRPPVVPREPAPAWRATWRYRLVALLLLALVVAGTVQLFRVLSGATAQDPGIGTLPGTPPAQAAPGHVRAGDGLTTPN